MYLPSHFREVERAALLSLMRAHNFATLITAPLGVSFASHVPLLVEEEGGELYLRSHLARANPQWQHFAAGETLVIFQGPHALVHSNWYDSAPNVPTQNYATVHARGEARIVKGEATRAIAYRLVAAHTPDMTPLPADFERRLLAGVVTFELRVTRLEGKFKLSQNKSAADRENVISRLEQSSLEHERDTARLMRERG